MSTPAGPGTPPPPPPYPPSPPRTDPPRWAWWVGGIAIPVVGILVTVAFGGKDSGPVARRPGQREQRHAARLPSPSGMPSSEEPEPPAPPDEAPSASASASASPEADLTAPDGYAKGLSTMWGLAPVPCTQHEQQLIDLDDGTSRTEDGHKQARSRSPAGLNCCTGPNSAPASGIYSCVRCPGMSLLRVDAPKSFDSCRAAAGTGFGALALSERNDRELRSSSRAPRCVPSRTRAPWPWR